MEFLLRNGEIAAKIQKSETTRSDFRIKTPSAGGSVRGTEFTMNYNRGTGVTLVTVKEGVVEVTPVNASLSPVTLRANQQVNVSQTAISPVVSTGGKPAAGGVVNEITGFWRVDETGSLLDIRADGNVIYLGGETGPAPAGYKRGDVIASRMYVVNESLISTNVNIKAGNDCPVMAPLMGSFGIHKDRTTLTLLVTIYTYLPAPTCTWTATSSGVITLTLRKVSGTLQPL